MGVLILGVNTLYRLLCFFKLFLMAGKGLNPHKVTSVAAPVPENVQLRAVQ